MYEVILLIPHSTPGSPTFPSANTWLISRRKPTGSAGRENLWSFFREEEKRGPEDGQELFSSDDLLDPSLGNPVCAACTLLFPEHWLASKWELRIILSLSVCKSSLKFSCLWKQCPIGLTNTMLCYKKLRRQKLCCRWILNMEKYCEVKLTIYKTKQNKKRYL